MDNIISLDIEMSFLPPGRNFNEYPHFYVTNLWSVDSLLCSTVIISSFLFVNCIELLICDACLHSLFSYCVHIHSCEAKK